MEKKIIELLIEQLDDFKKDQLLLLLIILIASIIINVYQTIYTSRKIDKYRNQLNKSVLKFSLFNELQIKSLSKLYELANQLKFGASVIYGVLESNSSNEIEIESWVKAYADFEKFKDSKKYILPKALKDIISEKDIALFNYNKYIRLYNLKIRTAKLKDGRELHNQINSDLEKYDCTLNSLETMLFSENIKIIIDKYFEKLE
jgi:hypothetical protein